MMEVAYRFSGFYEVARHDDLITLENAVANIQPYPNYIKMNILNRNGGTFA